jgi:hypothetical protein
MHPDDGLLLKPLKARSIVCFHARMAAGGIGAMLQALTLALFVTALGTGCAGEPAARWSTHAALDAKDVHLPLHAQIEALQADFNEQFEAKEVGGPNQPGVLVLLGGDQRNSLTITVHGIMCAPNSVGELSAQAADAGGAVATFAYDDAYRRLTYSARDLACGAKVWLAENPGKTLTFDGHSMGCRIILGALAILKDEGALSGRAIDVNLVAPCLAGYDSADWAIFAMPVLENLIPNTQPGKDMGTHSSFQKMLAGLTLPENVKVRVFSAGQDTVVDVDAPAFKAMVKSLGAQPIFFPDANHMSILAFTAKWLTDHPGNLSAPTASRAPGAYQSPPQ